MPVEYKHKLFLYGTLKEGYGNYHFVLRNADNGAYTEDGAPRARKYEEKAQVRAVVYGGEMYRCKAKGIPYVYLHEDFDSNKKKHWSARDKKIYGELWEVDDQMLAQYAEHDREQRLSSPSQS